MPPRLSLPDDLSALPLIAPYTPWLPAPWVAPPLARRAAAQRRSRSTTRFSTAAHHATHRPLLAQGAAPLLARHAVRANADAARPASIACRRAAHAGAAVAQLSERPRSVAAHSATYAVVASSAGRAATRSPCGHPESQSQHCAFQHRSSPCHAHRRRWLSLLRRSRTPCRTCQFRCLTSRWDAHTAAAGARHHGSQRHAQSPLRLHLRSSRHARHLRRKHRLLQRQPTYRLPLKPAKPAPYHEGSRRRLCQGIDQR